MARFKVLEHGQSDRTDVWYIRGVYGEKSVESVISGPAYSELKKVLPRAVDLFQAAIEAAEELKLGVEVIVVSTASPIFRIMMHRAQPQTRPQRPPD